MSDPYARLALLLASTAPARRARAGEIAAALRACDQAAFADFLSERRLLALLGSRACALAGDTVAEPLREAAGQALRRGRLTNLVYEHALTAACEALEAAGIPALALKGVALAHRAHGDAGLRSTTDTDVLVAPERVREAIEVLTGLGYAPPQDPAWTHGRPLLHYTLHHPGGYVPPLELHWRIHWSETRFSASLLETSARAPGALRVAEPVHDLAALLLFYARDGFSGLRLGADVAGWWDRHGERVAPGALDRCHAEHPGLRRSLDAALTCVQALGVPAVRLRTDLRPDRSARLATSIADVHLTASPHRAIAKIMTVDLLLSRGRDKLGFLRRYALHPLDEVRRRYGLEQRSRPVVLARGSLHAVGAFVKGAPAVARELVLAGVHA